MELSLIMYVKVYILPGMTLHPYTTSQVNPMVTYLIQDLKILAVFENE